MGVLIVAYMQVGDIKIQYDEKLVDIKSISQIIEFNQYLFADYKGKTISVGIPVLSDSNVIYISDFNKFFDDLLKKLLQDKNVITSLEHSDLLPALYTQLLVKKAIQNGDTVVMLDNNISDDLLWFMIACKFFDYRTNFNELADFLKCRHNSEDIFNWLKETQRFTTYNYLLEIVSNYLREYDLSFFNNIDEIVSKMTEESMAAALSLPNESDYDLPKMSLENIERMFFDFLDVIRAPEQWKNIYIKLKNENNILFEESIDGLEHSEVFKDIDGVRKIRVTIDGTINCFVSFVHEFMHYVSLQGNMPPFSLFELPSIYYEKVAANYLVQIGYDKNIIKQVIRDRNQNNLDIYSSLFGLLIDICRYNKTGLITKEDKIKPFKESMELIYETKKKLARICEAAGESVEDLEFLAMPNYNYEELVNKECDDDIAKFIKSGLLVLNGYQYLIDSYLANRILEKQDNDNTLDKMIFITEHLEDFNIERIIRYFGIDNIFDSESKSLKK